MALFAQMLKGLGDSNVDFRHWLTDEDFWLRNWRSSISRCFTKEVSDLRNIFIIGSRLRDDCPLLAQKVRLGANKNGMHIWQLGSYIQELLAREHGSFRVSPGNYVRFFELLLEFIDSDAGPTVSNELWNYEGLVWSFKNNSEGRNNLFLLGPSVLGHPQASLIIKLCSDISVRLNCKLGFLPPGGNFIGGYIAECVPQKKKKYS